MLMKKRKMIQKYCKDCKKETKHLSGLCVNLHLKGFNFPTEI